MATLHRTIKKRQDKSKRIDCMLHVIFAGQPKSVEEVTELLSLKPLEVYGFIYRQMEKRRLFSFFGVHPIYGFRGIFYSTRKTQEHE